MKEIVQFKERADAESYAASLDVPSRIIPGETVFNVLTDDRTLEDAKEQRMAALLEGAQQSLLSFSGSYDAIQSKLKAAQAKVASAKTNDDVDAVTL